MVRLKTIFSPWITIENMPAGPVQVGDWTATPYARIVSARLPFANGQLVWVRPTWIIATRQGSVQQRMRIRDATNEILLGLLGLTLAIGFALWSGRHNGVRVSPGGVK